LEPGDGAELRGVVGKLVPGDAFLALPLCKALGDRAQLALWVKRAGEERSTMAVYLRGMQSWFGIDERMLAAAGLN
jgi:hypothetical protein